MNRICHILLTTMMLISTATAVADDSVPESRMLRPTAPVMAGLSVHGGYLIPKGDHNKRVLHSYGMGYADLRLQWKQTADNADNRSLNFPTLEAGLIYGDYTHIHMQDPQTPVPSQIGREIAVYGGIQCDLWQHGPWRAGLNLQNGIAYFTKHFDPNRSPDNHLVGSPLSIYISFGGYIARKINNQWEVALGANFKHISNGTLNRPNLGANTIGPELRVSRAINGQQPTANTQQPTANSQQPTANSQQPTANGQPAAAGQQHNSQTSYKPLYLELSAGISGNTLSDQFNTYHTNHNPLYASAVAMVAPMYRYCQLMASGIEMDYSYATYADHIRFYDELNGHPGYQYSRHVLGIGVRHEFFYRQVSLHAGVGKYVYRHIGHYAATRDGGTYQTIGLRYSFAATGNRLFVGYNVKAHNFSKADCMQMHVGWRI